MSLLLFSLAGVVIFSCQCCHPSSPLLSFFFINVVNCHLSHFGMILQNVFIRCRNNDQNLDLGNDYCLKMLILTGILIHHRHCDSHRSSVLLSFLLLFLVITAIVVTFMSFSLLSLPSLSLPSLSLSSLSFSSLSLSSLSDFLFLMYSTIRFCQIGLICALLPM